MDRKIGFLVSIIPQIAILLNFTNLENLFSTCIAFAEPRFSYFRLFRRGREADVLNQQAGLLASIYCGIFLGKTLYFPITILHLIVLIVTIKLFAVLFLGKNILLSQYNSPPKSIISYQQTFRDT